MNVTQKRRCLWYFIPIFFIAFFQSCNKETVNNYPVSLDAADTLPNLDTVSLSYNYLFELKFGRISPFVNSGKEFIFYEGAYCKFFKYNSLAQTWTGNFTYNIPENNYNNNDVFNAGDSVVILASATTSKRYNLMSLKLSDLTMRYLKKDVLFEGDQYFSSSLLYENKIITLLHSVRKIMVIDLKTLSQTYITNYLPVYYESGDYYFYNSVTGQRNEYFYIYIKRLRRLFKMNLKTYQSEEIALPAYLFKRTDTFERGGMVKNLFCLWTRSSYYTFCYDVDNNKWLHAGKSPFGEFPTTSEIRYSDGEALYFNGGHSSSLLEVRKK